MRILEKEINSFHTAKLAWLWLLLGARSTSSRRQQRAPNTSSPMESPASHRITSRIHWTASIMGRAMCCPYWNTYSGYVFAFPDNSSARTVIDGLIDCLIIVMLVYKAFLSIKEHIHSRVHTAVSSCSGIHWSHHVPTMKQLV